MSHVVKILVAVAALAVGGYIVATRLLPADSGGKPGAGPPPAAPIVRGLDENVREELERATDQEAPDLFRQAFDQVSRTPARRELSQLLAARETRVLRRVQEKVDTWMETSQYRSAVAEIERYRKAWAGTDACKRMTAMLDELREEQAQQVESRKDEARQLYEAERYVAARESLRTKRQMESTYLQDLEDFAVQLERRMKRGEPLPAGQRTPGPGATPAPAVVRIEPTAPPALPGYPHPDVKRLAEARRLLGKARGAFGSRRYHESAKSLEELSGYYGDLVFVKRQRDAIGAMNALARHAAKGLGGLFNATSVQRKGHRVTLRYQFKSNDEYLDWEELATLPHQAGGEFKPARSGVRGTGATSYLLRGVFRNDVQIRCTARPNKAQSHGLVLAQDGLESRQLIWIVTNHWLVEGENYVKKRPGHSILMFGKGVNNDVPVDAPEIGFIFRGASITEPSPPANAEFKLSFRLKGDTMSGEIVYRGQKGGRKGSTLGDDGRGIERVRPGFIVLENSVVYSDVVIEGRLHRSFESRRLNELLDIASNLE